MQRIIVVGASLGGLRAAEAVRAAGFGDELLVIGEEPWLPYNRPPLSKEALAGGIGQERLELHRRRSVQDARWLLGTPVVAADLRARTVTLSDGTNYDWDGLVVATGLRARRLTVPDPDGGPAPAAGRHVLRTLDDAVSLRGALRPGARGVVIGAGFVGCEVAATAVGLGCRVVMVAPEEYPLLRALGPLVGAALGRRHARHGVRLLLGRSPVALEPAAGQPGRVGRFGRVGAVLLDDGGRVPADVVVEAIGCVPNVEWLRGTGLDLSDGVLTDELLRAIGDDGVVRPDVVAVGDVARFPNSLVDEVPRRVEHWSVPTDTARRAGPVLVAGLNGGGPGGGGPGGGGSGGPPGAVKPILPSFWSDQYGERLQSFGMPSLADEVRLLGGDPDGEFVAGYLRDGRLLGAAGIGLLPRLLGLREELLTPRTSP